MRTFFVASIVLLLVICVWGESSFGQERPVPRGALRIVDKNPANQLYAVNKAVEFMPYVNTLLKLNETGVTEQHWSVRQRAMKQ